MKRRVIFFTFLMITIGGLLYLDSMLPVITGYAAKNMASGVFVSGRTPDSMEKEDLGFFPVRLAKSHVDMEKKEVKSCFLWNSSKAVYVEGFGCVLVEDFPEETIKNRPYKVIPSLPERADTILWPMGDRLPEDVKKPAFNKNKMSALISKLEADTVPLKGTFALMIVYKGIPIVEWYRDDFNANTRFLSWSMAKSFTSTLTGIRIGEGKMNLDDPGAREWQNDERSNITLRHLLNMNSGLKWNENYGALSDVTIMLHKEGDMANYTAQNKKDELTGEYWKYSSGTTNIVCRAIRHTFSSDADYFAYPREALFNKIGMRSAVFEVDASGTFVGSSYLYATMRDYARYGLLYMSNGNWQGEQILSKEWIDFTINPAEGSDGKYGAFFWLNLSGDQPDAPKDTYMCKGHDGQFIFIIPSEELVVVRTGYSKRGELSTNLMLKDILEAVR